MSAFDCAVRFVLQAEGADSNDPHDPGGLTRFGISQRAHPDVDLSRLTTSRAIELYRTRYWQAGRMERLPPALAVALFDSAVQHGLGPATRMLQHTLGVTTDAVIGPITLGAAYRADVTDFLTNYFARRGVYYAHLGSFGIYGYGWFRRLFALAAYCRALAT